MAKISLRAYNREIDGLIESGQIEEAIAHCRHILDSYPKHVDTYRLLGKAYLENQRYGDAADVLQRVLSSIPEDFIAHLGMSIIREDEGNLDEAIWHMERAFEIQPANNAIQNELRRLYGRRDGLEPPKVRLTRAALARMYVKGDLYQQAIAELRAALAEDPQRIDIQALLAQVYAQNGQRVEAVEASSAVLRKLPYCLQANAIMANILANSEHSEEALPYRQRLEALDPYSAHTGPEALTPDRVADQAVSLEKPEWMPDRFESSMPGHPEWATPLDFDLSDQAPLEASLPGWLADRKEEPLAGGAKTSGVGVFELPETPTNEEIELPGETEEEPVLAGSTEEEALPDWMKTAGWSSSTGDAEQAKAERTEDTSQPADEELEEGEEPVKAEIPDWLRAIAPDQAAEEAPSQAEIEDLPWLEELSAAGEEEQATSWLEETQVGNEVPEASPAGGALVFSIDDEQDEIPEWIQKAGAGMEPGEETAESEPPAWLESKAATEAREMPSWLKGTQAEFGVSPASESGSAEEAEVAGEAEPAGDAEIAAEAQETLEETEQPTASPIPAWLQDLGGEPLYEGDTKPVRVARVEEPAAEGEENQAEQTAPMAAFPGWMVEEESQEESEAPTEEQAAAERLAEAEEPAEVEEAPMAPLPDWLLETEAEVSAGETTPDEPSQAPAFDLEEPEAGSDWLESLQSTAAEEQPIPGEEDRAGSFALDETQERSLPDWLKGLEMETEPEAVPADELPDWLQETQIGWAAETAGTEADDTETRAVEEGEAGAEPEPEPEAVPADELPDWLQETQAGWAAEAAEAEQRAAGTTEEYEATEAADKGALPDWLLAIETAEESGSPDEERPESVGPAVAEGPAVAGEPPASETAEMESVEAAEEETAPAGSSRIPDWGQAEDGGTLYEEDTKPVWVSRDAEPATAPDESQAAEMAAEASLPGWLEASEAPTEEQPAAEELLAAGEETAVAEEAAAVEEIAETEEAEAPVEAAATGEAEAAEGTTFAPLPDWMVETEEISLAGEAPAAEEETGEGETLAAETAQEISMDLQDEDAAFAWLEALAARQGADEGMLLPPEERLETPPEWVQEAAGTSLAEPEAEPASEATPFEEMEAAEEAETTAEAPRIEEAVVMEEASADYEETPVAEEALTMEEVEAPAVEEAPTMEEMTREQAPEPSTAGDASAAIPELPEWLQDLESPQTDVEPTLAEATTPDWLQEPAATEETQAEIEAGLAVDFAAQPAAEETALEQPGWQEETAPQPDGEEEVSEPGVDLPEEEGRTLVELTVARNLFIQGNIDGAVKEYSPLIKSRQFLPDIIRDLHEALYRYPVEVDIWQTLGDAYLRNDQLQEAMDAYTKAEELLR